MITIRKLTIAMLVTSLALFIGVAVAHADPAPEGCHGQSANDDCRPDPNENGQDCESHGVNTDGNEDHCEEGEGQPTPTPTPSESPSTTPSPQPSETPSATPPAPVVCKPSVSFGPWYGDPRTNITLKGPGTFTVKGGVQRFSGLRVIRATLECGETLTVNRYKVKSGKVVSVYLNGVLVGQATAPRI